MFYKPSYCCNCGDKIERAEWRLLDSRRFCQLCETEHKAGDIAQRAVVGIGLVLGLFGFSVIAWPEKPVESKLNNATVAPRSLKSSPEKKVDTASVVEVKPETIGSENTSSVSGLDGQTALQRKEQTPGAVASSDAGIFYCGAPTKKGTPCSRRVKTKGRCWQHEGIQ